MDEQRCICEHEPHDGECPEKVSTIAGSMSCGCDEYCPETNSCYCGSPHPYTPEHDDKACIHCEALCRPPQIAG